MTLLIELAAEDYEEVAAGDASIVIEPVVAVEVKQADGVLSVRRRARVVEPVGALWRNHLGIGDSDGPVIQVYLEEEAEKEV